MAQNRAKFGYLTYNDMLQKITDEVLDQHDIIFTKDTKETYIISSDLEPIALRSKVYVYNSKEDAIEAINNNTDTYVGQIVSILEGDTYRGYIVNKNSKLRTNSYTVSPLTDISSIDYNTLGNKPIINKVGQSNNPIIISTLENGIYSISGHFKIASNDVTTHLNPNATIFIVGHNDENISIKKIATKEIIDYTINDDLSTVINQYITSDYLKYNGYVTTSYVDEKLIALDFVAKEDMNTYVEELVLSVLDEKLIPVIDERIDKKILGATDEQIKLLFKN